MVQVIFLGAIIIVALFGLSKFEKIDKVTLIFLSISIVVLIFIFNIFEKKNDLYQKQVHQLNIDFLQDKNISCQTVSIDNKNFNITSNSFVAKQTSKYIGTIIPFENCFNK